MKLDKVIKILVQELKIKVEKKGSNFFFLCPFHNDKNPSLSFESKKMFFNCFGCDFKSKNIYYFWSSYKKISLEKTFENLSDLGYIKNFNKLSYEKKNEKNLNFLKFLDIFCKLYQNNLLSKEGIEVIDYLEKLRKISRESIRKFKIGACVKFDQLARILEEKENEEVAKVAIDLKLILEKNNKSFDFFSKKQAIFPIENENNEIVGFFSRKIFESENKYLFLPSNIFWEKSSVIYNYSAVLKDNKENFCYLVEGAFDVISMSQNGYTNCISLFGVIISNYQIQMLKKLNKKILIFFDGDDAGIEGSISVSLKLIENNIDCEIVENEKNEDPDDLCKKSLIEDIVKKKVNPLNFCIFYYYKKFKIKDNPQNSTNFINKMSKLFYFSKENIKKFLAKKISDLTNLKIGEVESFFFKKNWEVEETEGFEPSRA